MKKYGLDSPVSQLSDNMWEVVETGVEAVETGLEAVETGLGCMSS